MIPRTYPSRVNSTTGRVEALVSFISSTTGLQRWVDYTPVAFVTDATPVEGSYNNNGYIAVADVGPTTGLQAGKDYIRVYLDPNATDAWRVNSVGFIPVGYSGIGGIPYALFANNEQGVWYDPSDLSTLFQDSAGTVPVTAVEQPVGRILDKSGRGNHAFQATSTSRPVLSARYNLLLNTETLATQNVTTAATTQRLRFEGTGSITLSGTATGTYSAGSHTFSTTAGTLTLTVTGSVTKADLRASNDAFGQPAYQRVNTATDYDTTGFKPYLRFDGTDDWLQTNSINFTGTDKITVVAGVRKLSDAASFPIIAELSSSWSANNGTFIMCAMGGVGGTYYAGSRGTSSSAVTSTAAYTPPITNILTLQGDIGADIAVLRINGTQNNGSTSDQGSGNYGNYPLYIGRRGGATLPFNGRLYGLIVRGAATTTATIQATETYMNGKTGAY